MLTCDFENRGKKTLCEYLTNTIRKQIQKGILLPNEKLPSKRNLANHLGISVITVANAYAELIVEGYIFSIEKKGFFVAKVNQLFSENDSPKLNKNINVFFSKNEKEKSEKKKTYFANFETNSICYEKFPFSLWSRVMREVLRSPHQSLLERAPSQGVEELRIAISVYLKRFRNMTVNKDDLIIGAGTEYLYNLVLQLLGREKIYAVEDPGYKKTFNVLTKNGAKCFPVEIDNKGILVDKLHEIKASVVHVSPNHHFPTGIVMPVARRQELLNWASDSLKDRYIIEDDYDSEFRFSGKPLATLQSADLNNRVIYINTFSKTLSPSFRISYMVLPSTLSEKFKQDFNFVSCTVSSFEQFALAAFMNEGYYEKHLVRMKNYYKNLRNTLIFAIENSDFSSFVKIKEENSGLHFLLEINTKLSSEKLKQNFENEGLNIPLLSDYSYSKNNLKPTLVLNYSGIKKEIIQDAIIRIGKALQE